MPSRTLIPDLPALAGVPANAGIHGKAPAFPLDHWLEVQLQSALLTFATAHASAAQPLPVHQLNRIGSLVLYLELKETIYSITTYG